MTQAVFHVEQVINKNLQLLTFENDQAFLCFHYSLDPESTTPTDPAVIFW